MWSPSTLLKQLVATVHNREVAVRVCWPADDNDPSSSNSDMLEEERHWKEVDNRDEDLRRSLHPDGKAVYPILPDTILG